ncbi:MAG: LD-carboxypeptidase [Fimbriimonadaceae bacterium]|nr:LD-carboxypeptidase [Fimbriimonadaceae bacterium]MCO5298316.1 LD-carboxypeptidase [Fimbriimonadaceae bacterium]
MSALKPRALQPGDTIRIVSPASPLAAEKLANATRLLEDAGYRVDLAPHTLDRDDYLAGSDEDRARDLQDAFDDPQVHGVYCSRGGYGCARILPLLDLDRIARSGKLFAGFSDITTLHLALNRRGMPTLHAPMALTLSTVREPWVHASFLAGWRGENTVHPDAPRSSSVVGGVGEGIVVGGCLCLLTDSLGTPEALDAEGKIVVIEDVDENPHRVDAMLTHLRASGTLDRCAGIVVGEMTRTDDRRDEGIGGKPWREIVRDRLAPLGIPLVIDFPFGHVPQMMTLPLGVRARLDADAGTLEYLESPCA